MPLANFRKKFRLFSFDFRQIFDVRTFCGDWAYVEPNFFDKLANKFFSKMFTLILSDEFLDGFSIAF